MRILKGYSKDEQKEFKGIKAIYGYPLAFLTSKEFEDDCPNLCSLIRFMDTGSDDKQLLQDIADYINDKAEFAEPKKYYVQLIKGDCYSYLNITPNGGAKLYNRLELNGWKTKFTREEVVAINPNLVPFMEEVEK